MTTSPPRIQLDEAIERMGDRKIYIEIAHFFAGHLPESLQQITHALATENITEATRLVHSMKSNCATVGANELRDGCYTMEKFCRDGDIAAARQIFVELKDGLAALPAVLFAIK